MLYPAELRGRRRRAVTHPIPPVDKVWWNFCGKMGMGFKAPTVIRGVIRLVCHLPRFAKRLAGEDRQRRASPAGEERSERSPKHCPLPRLTVALWLIAASPTISGRE